jgi:hypothetical protein
MVMLVESGILYMLFFVSSSSPRPSVFQLRHFLITSTTVISCHREYQIGQCCDRGEREPHVRTDNFSIHQ